MKRVFLTGASSGIGLATAHALVAQGHEVWGTSRDPNRLPQLKHFHPVQLDLRHHSEIDGVFVTCLREAGHFDVLINTRHNDLKTVTGIVGAAYHAWRIDEKNRSSESARRKPRL